MSLTGGSRAPRVPTLPQGETVARYDTYLAAQRAVDQLADQAFPVQNVTIVGTDLQLVERVLSRLTYSRVALGGSLSGAWFGLFVGLLFTLLGATGQNLLFPAIFIGAGFGMFFSVISYAFTRGRRDFTSSSQIVAAHYAVLCTSDVAPRARALLSEVGGVVRGWSGAPLPEQSPPPPKPETGSTRQVPTQPGRSSNGNSSDHGSTPTAVPPPPDDQQPPTGFPPQQTPPPPIS